jgi:benzylsuccinate CoA-transferase BbsF subunit
MVDRSRTATRELVADFGVDGALSWLRVVDFGWAWAGATCGQVLADFGAEVIKVESRTRLDPMRQGRPLVGKDPDPEQNPICHNVNRNKFSFSVDLKHPEGPGLVRSLVAEADVVIENMTPGALARLGLAYEDLAAVNPQLIMVSLPAVTSEGPLARTRAYAPTVSGLSGLDSLVGYEGEEPLGFQQALPDPNVGLHAAVGVLAALRHRKLTGAGQYIQTSQLRAMLPLLGEAVAEYALTGRVPGTKGNQRRGYAPHGTYPAVGDDKWVTIAVSGDTEWRGLCRALGRPELVDDPRFADGYERSLNHAELDQEIAAWTRTRDGMELVETLQAHGVAAAPCLDTGERFLHAHFQDREAYVPVEHPVLGNEFIYGAPWKLRDSQPGVWKRVPLLGEDTDAILRRILGLSDAEVARLREASALQ